MFRIIVLAGWQINEEIFKITVTTTQYYQNWVWTLNTTNTNDNSILVGSHQQSLPFDQCKSFIYFRNYWLSQLNLKSADSCEQQQMLLYVVAQLVDILTLLPTT